LISDLTISNDRPSLKTSKSKISALSDLTPVAKVFGQIVCSFFGHSNVISDNEKQLVRIRIVCSFQICIQNFPLT
jgi:hypothetical protein